VLATERESFGKRRVPRLRGVHMIRRAIDSSVTRESRSIRPRHAMNC